MDPCDGFFETFDVAARLPAHDRAGSDKEPNSRLALDASKALLDARDVNNVVLKTYGESYVWMTWRRELADFAPRLLR